MHKPAPSQTDATHEERTDPEEWELPLAVTRLPWKKIFMGAAGGMCALWLVAALGESLWYQSAKWVTAPAVFVRQNRTLGAMAVLVRNEEPIEVTAKGLAYPAVRSGARVGAGQSVAAICNSSQDASAMRQRERLQARQVWLQEAGEANQFRALNADALTTQVADTVAEYAQVLASGDCAALGAVQERFLHRATTLDAALGRLVDVTEERKKTEAQLAAMQEREATGQFEQVPAPASGDFYATADGYEQLYTPEAALQSDPEAFWSLAARTKPNPSVFGKLVHGFRWYAAARMQATEAQQLREGRRYKVGFPQECEERLTMRVERIRRGQNGEALVVFSCDEKIDALQVLREARLEVVLETIAGLRVDAKALRFLNKTQSETGQTRPMQAVYIVRSGRLHVREVEVLHQDSNYAVVAWGRGSEIESAPGNHLQIVGEVTAVVQPDPKRQRIVVSGRDLFLTAIQQGLTPAVEGGATEQITLERKLFSEVVFSAPDLKWEQKNGVLLLWGEGITFKEQRGQQLKIHDTVLIEGGGKPIDSGKL